MNLVLEAWREVCCDWLQRVGLRNRCGVVASSLLSTETGKAQPDPHTTLASARSKENTDFDARDKGQSTAMGDDLLLGSTKTILSFRSRLDRSQPRAPLTESDIFILLAEAPVAFLAPVCRLAGVP